VSIAPNRLRILAGSARRMHQPTSAAIRYSAQRCDPPTAILTSNCVARVKAQKWPPGSPIVAVDFRSLALLNRFVPGSERKQVASSKGSVTRSAREFRERRDLKVVGVGCSGRRLRTLAPRASRRSPAEAIFFSHPNESKMATASIAPPVAEVIELRPVLQSRTMWMK
jgi:hypothetical protein